MALASTSMRRALLLISAGGVLGVLVNESAGARPRQPAPVVFADQAQTPSSAPKAATHLAAATGVKRISFRYPDQPDREYGYGDLDSRPFAAAEPTQAIDLRGMVSQPAGAAQAFDPQAAIAASALAVEPTAPPPQSAPPPSATEPEPVPSLAPQTAAVASAPPQRPDWLERERVGAPYQVNGRWYAPTAEPGYSETGHASWYGDQFHGKRTANGEIFDKSALTAAHPTLPIPSLVQVTNLDNGREVIVRVNDRGPFVQGRLIDVSHAAADVLDFTSNGSARVHVRYLGPAPKRVAATASVSPKASPAPRPLAQSPPRAPISAPERTPMREAAVRRADGGFMVQVGAFASAANANRVRQKAASAGDVTIDALPTPTGGEVFRVRIGPWRDRAAAVTALETIQALGLSGAIVSAAAP